MLDIDNIVALVVSSNQLFIGTLDIDSGLLYKAHHVRKGVYLDEDLEDGIKGYVKSRINNTLIQELHICFSDFHYRYLNDREKKLLEYYHLKEESKNG